MNSLLDDTLRFLCNNHHIGKWMSKFLFRRMVHQVQVEISSACNRQCEYCPHSISQRPTQIMEDVVLEKIISNLVDVGYSKQICLNLYNEPLLFKEHLFHVIKSLKEHLPKSRIMFSTNGDFLIEETLRRLQESGLDALYVTLHPDKAGYWSAQQIEGEIHTKLEELNLPGRVLACCSDGVHYEASYQNLQVTIFSLNFLKVGVDRAGAMKNIEGAHGAFRTRPCYRPLYDICVSYDGSVYPCCQFYHGLDANLPFLIGNVLDLNLFDIFVSPRMVHFRKHAIEEGSKPHPCRTCTE